ncbi:twin-arginine translocase TatA/TatE family subunit [Mangrovimicrobium sediminis]|uniref:Sec-independent protein translocase protein TatA n=1 Tax=Mangrovimicrobium sediminis TaxID=2562682 RepID=A0A4Z0LY36_9GAMM|nr:twin-arginine translocase TatA/TatE family subunit [Haliea sp. SAOS-164]TGD72199.1 twin-arginine translocase TatA/TatE family subunit [Haliea sp. SAOS-164]
MGISAWQLLIVLAIVLLLFGTKRLRSLGTDLGAALRGFRTAVNDESSHLQSSDEEDSSQAKRPTIEP